MKGNDNDGLTLWNEGLPTFGRDVMVIVRAGKPSPHRADAVERCE